MNLVMALNATQTMTSVEVVEVINLLRPEGAAVLAHSDFMKRCERIAKELGDSCKTVSYFNKQNKELSCYQLNKEMCLILVASESATVMQAIIRRWQELEALVNKPLSRLERLEAEVLAEKERLVMLETVKSQKAVIATKQVLTDDGEEYASIQRIRITNPTLRPSGKLLCRISLAQEYEIGEVYSHYTATTVNTYHKDIWELCYPDADFPE